MKIKEILLVLVLGLLVFGGLNGLMVYGAPECWKLLRYGAWTAFHKGFTFSGFDQYTYIILSEWRPLYELYRHPLLAVMMWPLSCLSEALADEYKIRFAIYIVAVVWTLVSLLTWWLLYRLLRLRIGLGMSTSLLLCLFYYGFAYVMLASFVPDHMLLTQCLLITMIYVATAPQKGHRQGSGVAAWKSLLLYFVATGVTTTNGIKIWLMDMVAMMTDNGRSRGYGMQRHKPLWRRMLTRSCLYLIPTLLMGGLFLYQQQTVMKAEYDRQEEMSSKRIARDSLFAKQVRADSVRHQHELEGQIGDSRFLAYTNTNIDRWPLLYENMLGEGLILHEEHLMEDTNVTENPRPLVVRYSHWWDYAAEACIVLLFVAALCCGFRERLLWIALMPMLFDMLLHIGLRFASADVYIMTAHWAFVIPLAIGIMIKKARTWPLLRIGLTVAIAALTAFLWWHNLALLLPYIIEH